MNENPYHAPVKTTEPMPNQTRRPALVWITQALLALIVLFEGFTLIYSAVVLPRILASRLPWQQLLSLFLISMASFVLAGLLFIGLARARRWAWHGGVLFALLVMVFVFYTRAYPSVPHAEIPSNQLWGAAAGELLVTILIVLYPFRMYFSKNVRGFLGV